MDHPFVRPGPSCVMLGGLLRPVSEGLEGVAQALSSATLGPVPPGMGLPLTLSFSCSVAGRQMRNVPIEGAPFPKR